MDIRSRDPEHDDARRLMTELSAALAAITGDSGAASFAPADVQVPHSAFLVAYEGALLLGCGALRPLDGERAEIKRMYARPGTAGVGAALLARLEAEAIAFGYTTICLSTRRVNRRAVDFYLRQGYEPVTPYGKYRDRPDSICLGKPLPAPE